MLNVDLNKLNNLEKELYDLTREYAKANDKIRILDVAEYCNVSTSKISKFVKKLGFANFKQYCDFLNDHAVPSTSSNELKRLQSFLKDFDDKLVSELVSSIEKHPKVILFGYGPSLLCAQYFEYRLRTCTNKVIMATSDLLSISSIVDEQTLIIILTVTGTFKSFKNIYDMAKEKGSEVIIMVEEYKKELLDQCDRIFWLSKEAQSDTLEPYEKTRTIFFIFFEEVVMRLQDLKRS
ncbi:MurR/RpiR family transcriptional regulator [Proteiniclasticum sp. BAD-10]|uniref:MurR/RpiR family transcriptional regulator n=1 Tax=Proteiniclasticum sediminis TaxID=2804028 RepID=A0A941HRW0_9CLOT|nr:SIS domain-containing protein [Proteiniclasticum sediminis]MBR0577390.1 MurR/RpiR family transcriptional regulator [Proteiniclasticum sediminis]